MKNFFSGILILLCSLSSAQTPSWLWARSVGGTSYELMTDVHYDGFSHLICAGTFSSPTATFGTQTLINNSVANYSDSYIAKYDTAGNVIWATSFGSISSDDAISVTSDPWGNIYVGGNFLSQQMVIGNDTLRCTDIWGDSADIFLAKFDSSGNPLWAVQAGAMAQDQLTSIEADESGNIYITGFFDSDTIAFGAQQLVNMTSGNFFDAFVAKYDSSGNALWARSIAGMADEFGNGTCIDVTHHILVVGRCYSDSLITSAGTIQNTSNPGNCDVFVARYDVNGTLQWLEMDGGWSDEYAEDVDTDANNNVFVCGHSYTTAFAFGTDSFINSSAFGTDVFLMKYDLTGNRIWLHSAGGVNDEQANAVHCDVLNNIYVTGSYSSSFAAFGTFTLTNSNPGYGDIFLEQLSQSGSVNWAIKAGGTSAEGPMNLTSDGSGGIYVCGAFDSSPCSFGKNTLNSGGWLDLFLAKTSAGPASVENGEWSEENAVAIYPSPANEYITIVGAEAGGVYTIYNVMGQEVKHGILSSDGIISVNDLAPGFYFVKTPRNWGRFERE